MDCSSSEWIGRIRRKDNVVEASKKTLLLRYLSISWFAQCGPDFMFT